MINFAVLGLYLLIGFILKRTGKCPDNTAQVLNLYVIYAALPGVIFSKVPTLEFSSELLIPVIIPWVLLSVVAVFIAVLGRALKWRRDVVGALLVCVPLGNTSFFGFPMIEAFYGSDAIVYGLLYDQFGSFIGLAIYSTIIIALYREQGDKPTVANVTRQIVSFPPFIALILALLTKNLTYPAVFQQLIESLALTLVPVIMIAVGFQLKFRLPKGSKTPLAIGLVTKLVLMPALAIGLLFGFGFDSNLIQVTVFESAMPPMITAGAVTIMAGLAPKLSAAMIGYGILFSFVSLPMVYEILQWLPA